MQQTVSRFTNRNYPTRLGARPTARRAAMRLTRLNSRQDAADP